MRAPWLATALALCACGAAQRADDADARGAPSSVRYELAVDASLSTMDVRVCFEGGTPRFLIPVHEHGSEQLLFASAELEDGTTRTIRERPTLPLPARTRCVRYRASLEPGGRSTYATARFGDALFAPTSVWMWGPEPRDEHATQRARFTLPEGVDMSALWPAAEDEPGWLAPDDRALRFIAYPAFGRLTRVRAAGPGGCVEATLLGEPGRELRIDEHALRRWMRAAADASARLTGTMPASRIGVVVAPTIDVPGMPVVFGLAGRGPWPTLAVLAGEGASEQALTRDWTLVHELAHLASPFVDHDEAWLPEGLATYYQEVLRARAGLCTPEHAWTTLDDGFRRGAASSAGLTLVQASHQMRVTGEYIRVYWAGAALALLADVAYRRQGDSLDAAHERAWDARDRMLRADELVARLDGRDGGAFAALAERWGGSTEFPELDEAYAYLGLRREGARIVLVEGAPGAAVRDAIMNASPTLASLPPGCETP